MMLKSLVAMEDTQPHQYLSFSSPGGGLGAEDHPNHYHTDCWNERQHYGAEEATGEPALERKRLNEKHTQPSTAVTNHQAHSQ